ncbi:MAG: 4'-phosphopantetheinyl transferase superfamily protein [Bacteroidales bacterium]|nr:4'-phosphopantetheinyl transferase superfamily protein [Bacteroidales bacterium]MDT8431911.1 4'-phosphopantetheinyl transferase superfamily protein [Bacteroidales bacterium]
MGIFLKTEIQPECLLGVWEITEEYDEIRSMVYLDRAEKARLASFRSLSRKLEWLSVRALIKSMKGQQAKITYNEENKPFLGGGGNISISHSRNLTAILVSPDKRVGIDLEYMSGKISKLGHKFMNERERLTENSAVQKFHLYLHWCAKEALYKICDKQDVNFREGITILPFEPEDNGFIRGHVVNSAGEELFDLEYLHHENYALVWSCKK